MKKRDDLVPLKQVAEEVGMSRTSLWRACRSNIPDFPAPLVIRRLVYWRRDDLERLDAALMRYLGRVHFERQREATQKIERLKRKSRAPAKRSRQLSSRTKPSEPDLFEPST
ncbi:MAG: hypothetical protein KF779_10410 [Hyphomonadaceae bacterium]|nr:hypothetical protein [Hyphomonadaceae bacterium]